MTLFEQFIDWLRPRAARSWPLDNAIQAQAFSGILAEEEIPHKIRRNGEALFAYAGQGKDGWGRLEADDSYHEQIEQLYQDFLASVPGVPGDSEEL